MRKLTKLLKIHKKLYHKSGLCPLPRRKPEDIYFAQRHEKIQDVYRIMKRKVSAL